ncbi:SLC13 family permease [Nocardia acidivorans]|uniref:SLC13 family permease n=1 Tax=Nocardia acidivorans TaxID=404580 RepID=UPI00082A5F02|nr:SLC13 family permease [Nocardia acidivorans]
MAGLTMGRWFTPTRLWLIPPLLAIAAVATGWLPIPEATEIVADRGAPILGFLIAATLLAELSSAAGVFEVAAVHCARLARGSTPLLFILVAVLATLITITLGLDTTAVLLTPVVLAMTWRLGLPALPFAVLVVWLANTASLLLPVSNLTNLLALQHSHLSTASFAARMALPELVAVSTTVLYLGLRFRRQLTGRYPVPDQVVPGDPITYRVCAAACVGFAVAVALDVAPWLAATVAALATVAATAARDRPRLTFSLIPWRMALAIAALFLLVAALTAHGLGDLITEWAARSHWQTIVLAATTSNVINNLPAYLALENAIPPGGTTNLYEILLGVNIGPLITIWGSLATVLWAARCRAQGVIITPRAFAAIALPGVPLVLLCTAATLYL